MRLITAHRILIAAAIAFFVFYAGWGVRHYMVGGTTGDLVQGLAAAAVAIALVVYFRTLRDWGRPR